MQELTVDPEFRDKIPPLTEDKFSLLEENILLDGAVVSPLIVWNGTILDGHNRYEIIRKHPELAYTIRKVVFDNRYEALSWICKNQLGRRNLTPQQKKYLIGQRYEAEKKADFYQGNQYTLMCKSGVGQIDPPQKQHGTRSRIAKETQTSESYVKRADQFAKGVDAAEEALPGIKQKILTGAIKPTETAVSAIARAGPSERPRLAVALKKPKESGQEMPAYHLPPSQSKREVIRQIRAISAEMEREKAPVTEADILRSLADEIDSFIELFDHTFAQFPALLSEKSHHQKLIQMLIPRTTYQRELNEKRVHRIAAEFDERIANEPKVSYRDGRYYVFDGQHTVSARKLLNGGRDLPIRCKVFYGLTQGEEALLFAQQTGASAPLTAGTRFRALVCGGDEDALAFLNATEDAGLCVDYQQTRGTRRLACISTAFRLYQRVGDELYREAMGVLTDAWKGAPDSLRAETVQGVVEFVYLYHGEYSRRRLVTRLRQVDPIVIFREGRAMTNLPGYKRYLYQVYRIYNGSSAKTALPIKF